MRIAASMRRRLAQRNSALGHATVAITLDVYSHAIPALQQDARWRPTSGPGRRSTCGCARSTTGPSPGCAPTWCSACSPATLTWHLRRALAPVTFADTDRPGVQTAESILRSTANSRTTLAMIVFSMSGALECLGASFSEEGPASQGASVGRSVPHIHGEIHSTRSPLPLSAPMKATAAAR